MDGMIEDGQVSGRPESEGISAHAATARMSPVYVSTSFIRRPVVE